MYNKICDLFKNDKNENTTDNMEYSIELEDTVSFIHVVLYNRDDIRNRFYNAASVGFVPYGSKYSFYINTKSVVNGELQRGVTVYKVKQLMNKPFDHERDEDRKNMYTFVYIVGFNQDEISTILDRNTIYRTIGRYTLDYVKYDSDNHIKTMTINPVRKKTTKDKVFGGLIVLAFIAMIGLIAGLLYTTSTVTGKLHEAETSIDNMQEKIDSQEEIIKQYHLDEVNRLVQKSKELEQKVK